jgi:hypothetical protein
MTVGSNTQQGAAYVFVQSGTSWTQQAELVSSDGATNDLFGASVAINGATAIVGAFEKTVGSNVKQGVAYVFAQGGTSWTQQAEFVESTGAMKDHFGASAGLSSTTAIIGSYGTNGIQGAAYVFVYAHTNGDACAVASDCLSGFCTEGVCCDTACASVCQSCLASRKGTGSDGTCGFVAGGGADAQCPAMMCVVPQGAGPGACNGSGACAPQSPASCGLYACNVGATACNSSCTSDGDCITTAYCGASGACVTQPAQGMPCNPASDCKQPGCRECPSGFCVDGYCCDQACTGACAVCSAALGPTTNGTCGAAPVGAPGRPSCGAVACNGVSLMCPGNSCIADASCGPGYFCASNGTCQPQKTQAQACNPSVDCKTPSCNECGTVGGCANGFCCGTVCTGACNVCNATPGVCTIAPLGYPGTPVCTPYACDGQGASCPTSCAGNVGCATGELCIAGKCSTQSPNGMQCSVDVGCMSGHCVGGICCDQPCAGGCFSCALSSSVGTCTQLPLGAACGGGDSGCGGTCDSSGTCKFVIAGQRCDTCKGCDGNGKCDQAITDDNACGTISCSGLGSECVRFDDLTGARCVSLGLCAAPNDPTICASSHPAPDGTACSGGVCSGGQCAPADLGTPMLRGHGGCSFGG